MLALTDTASGLIIAVATILGGAATAGVGAWIRKARREMFRSDVALVIEPALNKLGSSLGKSLDELRDQNSKDHAEVQRRLSELEVRLTAVEHKVNESGPQTITINPGGTP